MADQPDAETWVLWSADGTLIVRSVDGTVREATDDERQLALLPLRPAGPPPGWKPPPRRG